MMKFIRKNIAEAVFNGESKFFAIQSKTMKNSLVTHKVKEKFLETGNIVFSSIKRIKMPNNIYFRRLHLKILIIFNS